jgi:hypothetical protein
MSFFYRKSVKLGPFPRHKSCPESHGGFDFESAEVLQRGSAQGLRLSEIPQLPQSLAELSGWARWIVRLALACASTSKSTDPFTRNPFFLRPGKFKGGVEGPSTIFTMTKTWEGGSSGFTGIFTTRRQDRPSRAPRRPVWSRGKIPQMSIQPTPPYSPSAACSSPLETNQPSTLMSSHVDHTNLGRIPLEACLETLRGRLEAVSRLQGGHTHHQEELRIFNEVANEQGWFLSSAPPELSLPPSDEGNEHQVWFREAHGTFLKATWPGFYGWPFRYNPAYNPV